jgi:hypothetical protein
MDYSIDEDMYANIAQCEKEIALCEHVSNH